MNLGGQISEFTLVKFPSLELSESLLRDSLKRREFVTVAGNCECRYTGRASSHLGWGERLVLIKGDGSIQVHRPTGYEPVNWQPPQCTLHVRRNGYLLVIEAHRRRPREFLTLHFDRIIFYVSFRPVDKAEFNLYVSEEQMRDALIQDPNILEEGLELVDFERRVDPGFIDFYGRDADGKLVIVELKRSQAGKEAILQLKRYVDAVLKITDSNVRGVLAAPRLKSGAQGLLAELGLEFRRLSPRKCAEVLKKSCTRKISEFI
ncbi:MAG: endonuclease NucS [Candidatus Bathyarchaeia archaeon]